MKSKIINNFKFCVLLIYCILLKLYGNAIDGSFNINGDFNIIELFLTHQKGVDKTIGKAIYKNDHYDLQKKSTQLSLSRQNIKNISASITKPQNQTFEKNELFLNYQFCEVKQCFNDRTFTFRNVSQNVESLDISYNQIKFLSNRTFFGLQDLKELNVASNKLVYIESNAFEGLANLKKLDLSQNRELSNIDSNAFFGLDQLCFLNIANSKLNIITERTLKYLKNVEKLELSVSQYLKEIKDYGFYGLPNLISLDLSFALQLSIIGERSFFGLSNLKYLRLEQSSSLNLVSIKKILKYLNQLESLEMIMLGLENLDDDLFLNLGKLNVLHLNNNKLSNVKNAFKGLNNLDELNLESNNFGILNAYSFFSLTRSKLKKLRLNTCKIEVIETGAFYGLDNLRELSLTSNLLASIEPFIFVGMPNLTTLTLSALIDLNQSETNGFYGLENLKHLDLF